MPAETVTAEPIVPPTAEQPAEAPFAPRATLPPATESKASGPLLVRLVDSEGIPLAQGRVQLRRGALKLAEQSVDAGGETVFRDLNPGRYEVRLSDLPRGVAPPSPPVFARVRASSPESVTCVCPGTGSVQVRIVDGKTPPAQFGGFLRLREEGLGMNEYSCPVTSTTASRLDGVAAGTYCVTLRAQAHRELAGRALPPEQIITVEPGSLTEVAFELATSGPSLQVRVVDSEQEPLPEILVRVFTAAHSTPIAWAITGADGACSITGCPATQLKVQAAVFPSPEHPWGAPQAIDVKQRPKAADVDLAGSFGGEQEVQIIVPRTPHTRLVLAEWSLGNSPPRQPIAPPIQVTAITQDGQPLFASMTVRAYDDGRYRFCLDAQVQRIRVQCQWPEYGMDKTARIEPEGTTRIKLAPSSE